MVLNGSHLGVLQNRERDKISHECHYTEIRGRIGILFVYRRVSHPRRLKNGNTLLPGQLLQRICFVPRGIRRNIHCHNLFFSLQQGIENTCPEGSLPDQCYAHIYLLLTASLVGKGKLGVTGMNERSLDIGATLKIESKLDQITVISIQIPNS